VQDWEQSPQGRRTTLSDALETQHLAPAAGLEPVDEPSPPTVPLYLRSTATTVQEIPSMEAPAATDAATEAPATTQEDPRSRILTAQSAAIVDAFTKGIADALAVSLRPVVASAVVALLPMILSLGSIPEDEWPDVVAPKRNAAPVRP
jgi:hypothetical protein